MEVKCKFAKDFSVFYSQNCFARITSHSSGCNAVPKHAPTLLNTLPFVSFQNVHEFNLLSLLRIVIYLQHS